MDYKTISNFYLSEVDKNVTEFTIPDNIVKIKSNAFTNCTKLTKVTIPNSVKTIGEGAFSFCESLINLTIPSSVDYIGYSAFIFCESLINLRILNPNCHLDCSFIGTPYENLYSKIKKYVKDKENADKFFIKVINEIYEDKTNRLKIIYLR